MGGLSFTPPPEGFLLGRKKERKKVGKGGEKEREEIFT